MKNFFALLFFIHLSFAIIAQDSAGIQFEDLSWEEALEVAQDEDKIIFVDAYTTWCGPCKWMNANVFSVDEVGEFYNANFVNVKLDMEKGEGPKFARKYRVQAYPSLLFIDADGELVHQGVGSRAPADFVALGEAAADPNRQAGSLKRKYDAGERSPEFLRNFAKASQESRIGNTEEITEAYLASQEDWTTLENTNFIFEMMPYDNMDHKLYKYVRENRERFSTTIGAAKVDDKLKAGVLYSMMRKRVTDPAEIEAAFKEVFPKKGAEFASEWNLQQLMRAQDEEGKKKFMNAAVDHFGKYESSNWDMYNSIAWSFYESTENKDYLEKAASWAEKSIALESNFYNNDTAAALFLKLKQKEKGIQYAKEAIRLGKEAGEDTTPTEDLLKQLSEL
jgi:thiol-disulfide isomerase/thioredoxin